jgi:hypothetical protein
MLCSISSRIRARSEWATGSSAGSLSASAGEREHGAVANPVSERATCQKEILYCRQTTDGDAAEAVVSARQGAKIFVYSEISTAVSGLYVIIVTVVPDKYKISIRRKQLAQFAHFTCQ